MMRFAAIISDVLTNSTRRFFARPALVSLLSIGAAKERPIGKNRRAGMPYWLVRAATTASERRCESAFVCLKSAD